MYGHLPPITKTIQVRRTRHAGHCWRSREELIRDVLLWIPTHGRAKAGRPARTYIQQLCEDTGCCPEDQPRAMNDREEWRERVRDIRATSTIWWWWWYYTSLLMHRDGSSMMFPLGSQGGGSGLATSDLHPNDPIGIDLTPTPAPAAKQRIFHTKRMTAEMALSMGITFKFWQQPIRAWILWWLLKLSFKIGRPLCSCFPCRDDVVIRLFVQSGR